MHAETDLTSAHAFTLSRFIQQRQKQHGARGELSNILLAIALGAKIVSRGVNRAGLASLLGYTGEKNVQGEEVQKLDEYADLVFRKMLGRSGEFTTMVSEEQPGLIVSKHGTTDSDYVIAFDPLDGSSNIDVNVAIGSIWGIYKRISDRAKVDPNDFSDYLQNGHQQVAAGYTIYGSSTMLVYSVGEGVHGFTLDPTLGEFILTSENMRMPKKGKTYSCNEGNSALWSAGVRAYVDWCKDPNSGDGKPYGHRYVGSLVADFHRTMLKGGIFLYPADAKNKSGKLRLLYECAPMAFIVEQAGGRAIDGSRDILDIVPETIHQRTPMFIGSTEMVNNLAEFIKKHDK